jgi:hypothetical protein
MVVLGAAGRLTELRIDLGRPKLAITDLSNSTALITMCKT